MAATAISLHLRPNRHRFLQNPNLSHLFSSSSSSTDHPNSNDESSPPSQSEQPQQSSFNSYFRDVKASLKQSPSSSPQQRQQKPTFSSSIEEIRKNLSEFRRRSNVPPPQSNTPALSFQELYKRNVLPKGEGGGGSSQDAKVKTGHLSIDAIRESLKHMRRTPVQSQPQGPNKKLAFEKFGEGLKLQPPPNLKMGETESDVKDKETDAEMDDSMKIEFVKMYSYGELGEKLRKLRPDATKGKKSWFSLEELNDRLRKLREIEEKATESRIGGITFKDLRESLVKLQIADAEKKKKNAIQRMNVLGQLGGTPSFMLSPPKEELVEKYFHPDHMSSAEKLKLELKKVRDKFKMSESDCGSARVQVAQLTTKIKHLSTALHKKDKHSRKGLQAMVQQRKKLLKYLRSTDWDSYCLVLSKLGLRDNPDYKH